jgi:hypothetical protein
VEYFPNLVRVRHLKKTLYNPRIPRHGPNPTFNLHTLAFSSPMLFLVHAKWAKMDYGSYQ